MILNFRRTRGFLRVLTFRISSLKYEFWWLQNGLGYSVNISYFTNIEVQNVNKAFVYVLDFTKSLKGLLPRGITQTF